MKIYSNVNAILGRLQKKVNRAKNPAAFLRNVAYPMYQRFQRQRWMTQNASEGDKWKPLNPRYAKSKLRRYADFPGGGQRMMIATGRLFASVIGPSKDHRRLIKGSKMIISTGVEYAEDANSKRPFFPLSDRSKNQIYREFQKWVMDA